MSLRFALLACVALASGAATPVHARPPTLVQAWSTQGFANPESVALEPGGKFLFVSNVAGEGDALDGNGFISKVSLDGEIIEREWAKGLNGPKGLAVAGERLFVSDVHALVEVDVASGEVRARHEIADAGFLNDVAIGPGDAILVSDSAKARINAFRDGRMTVWLEDELLRSVNGLLVEKSRLIVTTMQGRLLAVDWKTRAITVLAEGLGNADGVVALGGGAYLVGEWPGRLFHVARGGTSSVVLDTRDARHFHNDFMRLGDRLIVPNWEPGTLTAYRIRR